jgi:hypothetical protein
VQDERAFTKRRKTVLVEKRHNEGGVRETTHDENSRFAALSEDDACVNGTETFHAADDTSPYVKNFQSATITEKL